MIALLGLKLTNVYNDLKHYNQESWLRAQDNQVVGGRHEAPQPLVVSLAQVGFDSTLNLAFYSLHKDSQLSKRPLLGPLLFLIFINDLPNGVSSSIRFFADDCVLYRRIAHRTDHDIIQNDLHQTESWCSISLMKVNTSKCKVMQISRKCSNSNYMYSINSIALSFVESYHCLGVTINKKLTWSDHITKLAADTTK